MIAKILFLSLSEVILEIDFQPLITKPSLIALIFLSALILALSSVELVALTKALFLQ